MKVQLIFGTDGSLAVVADKQEGVDFEEAKAKIEALKTLLGGLPIQFTGDVEMHTHPHDVKQVHYHVRH